MCCLGTTSDSPQLAEPQHLFAVLPEMAWAFWTLSLHFPAFFHLIPTPGDPHDPFRGHQFGLSANSVTDKLCGLWAPLPSLYLSFHPRRMGTRWLFSESASEASVM